MDNGLVVEQGTHEKLMARHGFYYNLQKLQDIRSGNSL